MGNVVSSSGSDIKNCNFEGIARFLSDTDAEVVAYANVPGYTESAVSFACSKMMNEIHLITSGKSLDGSYNPHLKIKTFLMIYDFCKRNLGEEFVQHFKDNDTRTNAWPRR